MNSKSWTGGCQGSTAELAYDYVTNMFQEFQYSYDSYFGKNYDCALPSNTKFVATVNEFKYLPENSYTALLNAIAAVGPIAISVDASWSGYESVVYE